MSDVANILKWVRETDVKDLPYNVVGLGWGPKIKNGVETGEYCLLFTVSEKLPLSAIPFEEQIPKYLEVDGSMVRTDVNEPVVCQKLLDDCYSGQPTIYNPSEPVLSNRKNYRPLKGGISSISFGGTDATLGLLVRDQTDGQIVALSNNHVYGGSCVNALIKNTNEDGYTTVLPISSRQPASISHSPYGSSQQADYIGTCKRAVVVGDNNPATSYFIGGIPVIADTSCDAAILSLKSYDIINNTSGNVVNFSELAPYEFATDAEIDSLVNPSSPNYKAPIFRSGRTCGPVGFPGYTNSCNLSVYQLNSAVVGLYSNTYSNFTNSFFVRGDVVPGRGGDSGSAMFALLSSNVPSASAWKCIGLLFAGPNVSFPDYTIGCRITNIANKLKIIPWNTATPTVSSSKRTIQVPSAQAPGVSIQTYTTTLSGRQYFQVGWLS
jgi:hypothetical protein